MKKITNYSITILSILSIFAIVFFFVYITDKDYVIDYHNNISVSSVYNLMITRLLVMFIVLLIGLVTIIITRRNTRLLTIIRFSVLTLALFGIVYEYINVINPYFPAPTTEPMILFSVSYPYVDYSNNVLSY